MWLASLTQTAAESDLVDEPRFTPTQTRSPGVNIV
jgi:hypothetical protein